MLDLEHAARIARETAVAAGRRLGEAVSGDKRVEYKSPIDLVTDTDRAVEALIVERLQRAFPDHLIVGEEGSTGRQPARPAEDRYAWYVDPLDGTTNFAHGHPQFAVSLALARGAELLLGVVLDPLRDELFAAVQGGGATLNGEPIHVSAVAELEQALLATGLPYDRRARLDFYLEFIKVAVRQAQGIRRAGSAALDLCYLACGRFDAYWEWKLGPWDHAAGALIVREAGGWVTDMGRPLRRPRRPDARIQRAPASGHGRPLRPAARLTSAGPGGPRCLRASTAARSPAAVARRGTSSSPPAARPRRE
jgi:myo-inositol-1(or 4)-monophosphatase